MLNYLFSKNKNRLIAVMQNRYRKDKSTTALDEEEIINNYLFYYEEHRTSKYINGILRMTNKNITL